MTAIYKEQQTPSRQEHADHLKKITHNQTLQGMFRNSRGPWHHPSHLFHSSPSLAAQMTGAAFHPFIPVAVIDWPERRVPQWKRAACSMASTRHDRQAFENQGTAALVIACSGLSTKDSRLAA